MIARGEEYGSFVEGGALCVFWTIGNMLVQTRYDPYTDLTMLR